MKIKSRTCWVRPPLTWGTRGPCSVGYRPQQLRGVGAVAPGTNPRHGTRCNLPFRVKPGGFVSRPAETETLWYSKNTAVPAPGLAFGRLETGLAKLEMSWDLDPRATAGPPAGRAGGWDAPGGPACSRQGATSPHVSRGCRCGTSEGARRSTLLSEVWVGGHADRWRVVLLVVWEAFRYLQDKRIAHSNKLPMHRRLWYGNMLFVLFDVRLAVVFCGI